MIRPLLAFLAFAGPAFADSEPSCGPADKVLAALASKFGESPIGAGVTDDGSLILTENPETDSWTLLLSQKDGSLCLIGAGDHWTAFELRKPGSPT